MFGWLLSICKGRHCESSAVNILADTPKTDISEPVLSIVKTFDEKGRWKISTDFNPFTGAVCYKSYISWTAKDSITGEAYCFCSYGYYYILESMCMLLVPRDIVASMLPTWMTDNEKEYVADVIGAKMEVIGGCFEVIRDKKLKGYEKQAHINQQKERARIMKLYLGEK